MHLFVRRENKESLFTFGGLHTLRKKLGVEDEVQRVQKLNGLNRAIPPDLSSPSPFVPICRNDNKGRTKVA